MKKANKLIALMLTLALLLSLAAVPAGAAETVTLQDGGFEGVIWHDQGGPWSYWIDGDDWGSKTMQAFQYSSNSWVTKPENGGEKCINFYMSAAGTAYFTQELTNVPAGTYTVTVDAMGNGGETVAVIMGDMIGETVQNDSGNSWKTASGTFTLNQDCDKLIVGVKITCTTGGWGYFDNLTLTKVEEEPEDYYLVGWIEGANCSGTDYKFENGSLSMTFSSNAYVAVTDADGTWYMTDGWLGESVTSAVLYDSSTISKGDKLFVPAGSQTLTLVENEDGTLTLSCTAAEEEPSNMKELTLENGDFELGNANNWVLSNYSEVATDSYATNNKTNALTLWLSNSETSSGSASYTVNLTAGTYYFTFDLAGGKDGATYPLDSGLNYTVSFGNSNVTGSSTLAVEGWDVWATVTTEEFTLTEDTEVTFTLSGTQPAGFFGDLDNLKLYGTGALAEKTPNPVEADIYVPYIKGTAGNDFMRGMDISSLLSVLNSGAKYYDDKGNELDGQGFMNYLAACGTNWVRIRVWNDPFDKDGNGYGGGNCDIEAAKTMGQWATNAGMKVLIDFHYSDFWADPGKQQAPKAWADYTVDEKATAIEKYTYDSLKMLLDAGVDVGMVQIGNETTNSMCGVSNWADRCKLFSAGAKAVRDVSGDILVAIHFTNPERSGNYANFASQLNTYGVDYDVFASSYYSYWHGTLDNLTSVLKQVADTYGKKVIVAETSWAYTLDDGDGHDNTVRKNNNDSDEDYTFSAQGQATEVAAVTQAVRNVGAAGIGVFYWEPAWIPVGAPENLEQNKVLWEEHGSGWASSYAGEYDPSDAGVWYGGSAWDNQAMFAFDGKPLESLKTYLYMQTGTTGYKDEVYSVEEPELSLIVGESLTLPTEIDVVNTRNEATAFEVTWDEAEKAAVDTKTVGTYTISGKLTDGTEVTCTVTVKPENLLQNPGFENSDMSMYKSSQAYAKRTTDDPYSGSYSLHFYNTGLVDFTAEQTVTLQPGHYEFSLFGQGGDVGDNAETYAYVKIGDTVLTEDFALTGWAIWVNPTISFAVSEETTVTVGINVTASQDGAWGTFDDWYLCEDVTAAHTSEDDGDCTTEVKCVGCGAVTKEAKADHTPGEDDGDCTTARECTECGTVTTEARDSHTGGRATCCTKAVCEVCGKEYGETVSNRHSGGLAVLDRKAATEFEDGYSGDVYCLGCGKKIQTGKVIPATHVHSFDTADCTHAATCECGEISGEKDSTNHVGGTELKGAVDAEEFKDGYTGDTHCLGCGEIIAKGQVIPATHVHVFSEATCSAPATCQCGATSGEKDADNHVGGTEIKGAQAATEDAEGYTGDTHCLGCGEKLETGKVIPKLEIEKPEDPKPEDPKPEDPKPENTKPEDTKPEDENPKTGDLLWIHVVALLTSAAVLPTFKRRR